MRFVSLPAWLVVLAVACTPTEPAGPRGEAPVAVTDLHPAEDPFLVVYEEVQRAAATMSKDDFLGVYPPPQYLQGLSYDPMTAVGLGQIQAVFPETTAPQTAALAQNGFVAMPQYDLSTFESGYLRLYNEDLPVLITTDSILYALHRSFDAMLKSLERSALSAELTSMLAEVHGEISLGSSGPAFLSEATQDLDVYITVARQLLVGTAIPTATGTEADRRVAEIMEGVAA